MRTLHLGTGPELVQGSITDLLRNDMISVQDVIELAVSAADAEDAPTSGWTLRDEVRMLGNYTVMPSKLYTPSARGMYALWGRWTNGSETVLIRIGRFRVV